MKRKNKNCYAAGGAIDVISSLAPIADLAIPGLGTGIGAGLQILDTIVDANKYQPMGMVQDNSVYSYAYGGGINGNPKTLLPNPPQAPVDPLTQWAGPWKAEYIPSKWTPALQGNINTPYAPFMQDPNYQGKKLKVPAYVVNNAGQRVKANRYFEDRPYEAKGKDPQVGTINKKVNAIHDIGETYIDTFPGFNPYTRSLERGYVLPASGQVIFESGAIAGMYGPGDRLNAPMQISSIPNAVSMEELLANEGLNAVDRRKYYNALRRRALGYDDDSSFDDWYKNIKVSEKGDSFRFGEWDIDTKDFQRFIKAIGKGDLLGKYGVDGKWGKMTANAWKKYGEDYLLYADKGYSIEGFKNIYSKKKPSTRTKKSSSRKIGTDVVTLPDGSTLPAVEFQQWLVDTGRGKELGKYGVDGRVGKFTKAALDKYGAEFVQSTRPAPQPLSPIGTVQPKTSFATGGRMDDVQLSSNATLIQGNPQVTDGNTRIVGGRRVRLDHNEVVANNTIAGTYALSPNLINPSTGNTLAEDGKRIQKAKGKAEKFLKDNPEDVFAMNTKQFADYLYNKLVLENERQLQNSPQQGNTKHVMQTSYQGGGQITTNNVPFMGGSRPVDPNKQYPVEMGGGNTGIYYPDFPLPESIPFIGGAMSVPSTGPSRSGYVKELKKTHGDYVPGTTYYDMGGGDQGQATGINPFLDIAFPDYPPQPVKSNINNYYDMGGGDTGMASGINPLLDIAYPDYRRESTFNDLSNSNRYTKDPIGVLAPEGNTQKQVPTTTQNNAPTGSVTPSAGTSTATATKGTANRKSASRTKKGGKYPTKISRDLFDVPGTIDAWDLPEEIDVREFQQWVKDNGAGADLGKAGVDGKLGPKTTNAWKKYGSQFLSSKYATSPAPLNNPKPFGPNETPQVTSTTVKGPKSTNNPSTKGNRAISDIPVGDILQSIAALSRFTGLGLEKERLNRVPLNQISVDPYLQDAYRTMTANRNMARSYAAQQGLNQGIYANTLNQINRIRSGVDNINTQLRTQNNRVNTQIGNQEIDLNARNRAAQDQAIQTAFSQLGLLGQAFNNKRSAQDAIAYLSQAYPDIFKYFTQGVEQYKANQ